MEGHFSNARSGAPQLFPGPTVNVEGSHSRGGDGTHPPFVVARLSAEPALRFAIGRATRGIETFWRLQWKATSQVREVAHPSCFRVRQSAVLKPILFFMREFVWIRRY
jgi:hypothetical protein